MKCRRTRKATKKIGNFAYQNVSKEFRVYVNILVLEGFADVICTKSALVHNSALIKSLKSPKH